MPSLAEPIEEFLFLIKNQNKIFLDIYKVSRFINNVVQHLTNLIPTYTEKARDFADKIKNFVINGSQWKGELEKLNIRKQFKFDFDDQLQELCVKFVSLGEFSLNGSLGNNQFRTFREFVTKKTDDLIQQIFEKLNIVKQSLGEARSFLEKMSNSVEDINEVLVELRPFSEWFLPVLQEVLQFPSCPKIHSTIDDIISRCGRDIIIFGRDAYNAYSGLRSEVKAFLELLPEEWSSLYSQKCFPSGTCVADAFKSQARDIYKKMETFKKIFGAFDSLLGLESCRDVVEEVAYIFGRIKNFSMMANEFLVNVSKIENLARRITGKFSGNDEQHEASVSYLLRHHNKFSCSCQETIANLTVCDKTI